MIIKNVRPLLESLDELTAKFTVRQLDLPNITCAIDSAMQRHATRTNYRLRYTMRSQGMIKKSELIHPAQLDDMKLFESWLAPSTFELTTPENVGELDAHMENYAAHVSTSKRRVSKAEAKVLRH